MNKNMEQIQSKIWNTTNLDSIPNCPLDSWLAGHESSPNTETKIWQEMEETQKWLKSWAVSVEHLAALERKKKPSINSITFFAG